MNNSIDLREATSHNHKAAEKTAFSQAMINSTLTEVQYHNFIFNMLAIYGAIERRLHFMPDSVKRADKFKADLTALGRGAGTPTNSTNRYVDYIDQLDVQRAWAHAYVHYLGNMYGGQILAKKIPWQHSHLEFDNLKQCINYIRANITDVDPAEANNAFEWIIKIYDELHYSSGPNSSPA